MSRHKGLLLLSSDKDNLKQGSVCDFRLDCQTSNTENSPVQVTERFLHPPLLVLQNSVLTELTHTVLRGLDVELFHVELFHVELLHVELLHVPNSYTSTTSSIALEEVCFVR